MKHYNSLVVLLALAGIFTACGPSGSGTTNTGSSTAAPATAADAKPESYVYSVQVENLRLREQPNQNSGVLLQLAEGDLIEGAGQVSENQEEIKLRGISIKAPYVQVEHSGKQGWAFEGALLPVYNGPRANVPDRKALTDLGHFLKTLPLKSSESGGKAWAYVKQQFGQAQGPLADAAFLLLENYMHHLATSGEFYQLFEKITWQNEEIQAVYDGTFDANSKPVTKTLVANGFRLAAVEGTVLPIVDWRTFQAFFGPKCTSMLKRFIDQRTTEQNEPIYDDGGVIVPLQTIADHAAAWEKFNRDFPYFVLQDQTRSSENWLRLTVINGADNTPAFNPENGLILDEFKNTWTYIQQKYPGTELAARIKQISEICASEGWKRGPKTEEFQTKLAEECMNF